MKVTFEENVIYIDDSGLPAELEGKLKVTNSSVSFDHSVSGKKVKERKTFTIYITGEIK